MAALDSQAVKDWLDAWLVKQYDAAMVAAQYAGDPLKTPNSTAAMQWLGWASGIQACQDRLKMLRGMSQFTLKREVENLTQEADSGQVSRRQ